MNRIELATLKNLLQHFLMSTTALLTLTGILLIIYLFITEGELPV